MKRTILLFAALFYLSNMGLSFAQIRASDKTKEKTKEKTEAISESAEPVKKEENVRVLEIPANTIKNVKAHISPKPIKLKVTLLELQSATTQNGELAHLSVNQHAKYTVKGKEIYPVSKDVTRKAKYSECPLDELVLETWRITVPKFTNFWEGSTAIICGNRDEQIHVNQSKLPLTRNPNIQHYLIYELTPEQANDKNAEFLLDTYVVEYSTDWKKTDTSIALDRDQRRMKVAIYDVLNILQGKKAINESQSYVKDGSVPASFKFDHFDGISLPLRNVNKDGKIILEGPIRARNKGSKLIEKAFVWMRFELVD